MVLVVLVVKFIHWPIRIFRSIYFVVLAVTIFMRLNVPFFIIIFLINNGKGVKGKRRLFFLIQLCGIHSFFYLSIVLFLILNFIFWISSQSTLTGFLSMRLCGKVGKINQWALFSQQKVISVLLLKNIFIRVNHTLLPKLKP